MNNRGNIPITILVIGIVGVCALAIFSFYTSTGNVKDSFSNIQLVEKVNSFSEEIKFYENLGKGEEVLEEDLVIIRSLSQDITFSKENGFIEGFLMKDGKRILWIRQEI